MANASAALRRLGAELRRLRETTGRTQADVGAAIGRTHTSLVNWERGKTRISKSDLAYLLAELRAPTELRKGLERLREEAGQGAGQWAVYNLPAWLRPVVSFEEDAVAVANFEPVIVPGLLQTEDYATAIYRAAPHAVSAGDVERWVAARMQRQQRLTGTDPLRFHAVIAESALRLEVGGAAVLADQLRRLLEVGGRDNVTIQVLAGTTGAQGGAASNFMILHFADPATDPPLAAFDGPLGGHVIDDEGDVAALGALFADVATTALPAGDSAEMIAAILAESLERGTRDA